MDYYETVCLDTVVVGERVEFYTIVEQGPINGIVVAVDRDFFVIKHESIPGGIVRLINPRKSYMKKDIKSIYVIGRVDTDLGV